MLPRHAPLPLRRHRSECPDHLLPRHAPLPLCRHRSECLDHLLPSPPGRQAAAKQREGGLSSAVELVPGSSVIITRKEKNAGIFSLSLLIAVAFLPVLNCWFVCWRKDWVNQRLPCSADSAAKILWLIEHTVTVAGSYSAKTAQRKFQKKKTAIHGQEQQVRSFVDAFRVSFNSGQNRLSIPGRVDIWQIL
jgi:hypothetical protein